MTHLNIPFPSDSPEYRHAYYKLKHNPNAQCTGKHSYKRGSKPLESKQAVPEPEPEPVPGALLYENYYYKFYENNMIYSKNCYKWLTIYTNYNINHYRVKLNGSFKRLNINLKDNINEYIQKDECKINRYSQKSQ